MIKQPMLLNILMHPCKGSSSAEGASASCAKLPSSLFNMLVVLTTISAISAFALSYTHIRTKDLILAVQKEKELATIRHVAPDFDNDPLSDAYTVEPFQNVRLYPLKLKGRLNGLAVKTFSDNGYGGTIWLMVGFDLKGKIIDTAVLQHRETPGLGANMKTPSFKDQFKDKSPQSFHPTVKKDGGEIDAITGATITSRAFCEAVAKAYDAYKLGGSL